MMDTVRIEYMLVNEHGSVIANWITAEGGIMNDPMTYFPRANQVQNRHTQGSMRARVRVVSEQSNRIVDIVQ